MSSCNFFLPSTTVTLVLVFDFGLLCHPGKGYVWVPTISTASIMASIPRSMIASISSVVAHFQELKPWSGK
jgi:hypothetical protein